jgi:hypothetical protein
MSDPSDAIDTSITTDASTFRDYVEAQLESRTAVVEVQGISNTEAFVVVRDSANAPVFGDICRSNQLSFGNVTTSDDGERVIINVSKAINAN